MEKEVITGDGRIFQRKGDGTYHERGGKGAKVSHKTLKEYSQYTGAPVRPLTDVSRESPRYAQMMWDKGK